MPRTREEDDEIKGERENEKKLRWWRRGAMLSGIFLSVSFSFYVCPFFFLSGWQRQEQRSSGGPSGSVSTPFSYAVALAFSSLSLSYSAPRLCCSIPVTWSLLSFFACFESFSSSYLLRGDGRNEIARRASRPWKSGVEGPEDGQGGSRGLGGSDCCCSASPLPPSILGEWVCVFPY